MRLGIVADIHEAVELLARAVAELESRRVDATVMLGDILSDGERIDEVVSLMSQLPGPGVWGNHDFGLCGVIEPGTRDRFSPAVLEYFAGLRPSVELAGWRFQHIDPYLDPERFEDLWCFPTPEERIAGVARCAHARALMGHIHEWGIFTPEGRTSWSGEEEYGFVAEARYLVQVDAVTNGWCAVLDTDRDSLEPVRLG